MFYVYILKSTKDNKLYFGYTNNLKRRVKEHNEKQGGSTRPRAPFILIYYEAYKARSDAREREKQLKRFAGAYTHLKKRLNDSLTLD